MTWTELWKKEWKASSFRFLIGTGLLIILLLAILYVMARYSPLFFLLGFVAIFAHVIALFLELLQSLHREWKENTVYVWLNLPLPGWQLLSAKIAVLFIQSIFSLLITIAFTYFFTEKAQQLYYHPNTMELSTGVGLIKEAFGQVLPFIILFISFVTLLLGLAAIFIYLMSKVIKPFGWVVGTAITIAFFALYRTILDSKFYTTITEWGLIKAIADIPEMIFFQTGTETKIEVGEVTHFHIYTGEILFNSILLIIIFLCLSWLLDRKVQV